MAGLLGILGAMREEIDSLIPEMRNRQTTTLGMREYHRGLLWSQDCVLVFSRIGKVAASSTATTLISHFGVERLIFTGVAGGVAHGIAVGDVVIGTGLIQHDMDASPLFPQREIPLLSVSEFKTDTKDTQRLHEATERFLKNRDGKIHPGLIVSGDQFFSDSQELERLREEIPQTLCVEMEGAAVAQICHEYGIPFSILRVISDSADEHAAVNFQTFLEKVATQYSHGIIRELLTH